MPREQAISPTILFVEDHFLTRWSAAEVLRFQGFRVIEATSLSEALSIAASGVPIDLVFSDIQLPAAGEGFVLAQWFAKHRSGTPVLLTSGDEIAAGAAFETLSKKSVRFVRKPYDLEKLVELMRAMLAMPRDPLA